MSAHLAVPGLGVLLYVTCPQCMYSCIQDEWLTCQRTWLYLGSVFCAPDIQRQLPTEAKLFITVDKSYKDIMRRVFKVRGVIRSPSNPQRLCGLSGSSARCLTFTFRQRALFCEINALKKYLICLELLKEILT